MNVIAWEKLEAEFTQKLRRAKTPEDKADLKRRLAAIHELRTGCKLRDETPSEPRVVEAKPKAQTAEEKRKALLDSIAEIENPSSDFGRKVYYDGKKLKPDWAKALAAHKRELAELERQAR